MRQVIEKMMQLVAEDRFLSFQNDVVACLYEALGQGYSANENEVALVKRLVEAANGQNYGALQLSAAMLHGSRSYVEFNYLDKPVTKELGDMAVITVVTSGRSRLFQRISIIQNKKNAGEKWDVDLEQLFLLKNFPPFSGNKGIFKGCGGLAFRNLSGCLGAFGLLNQPGEMMFAAAPLVTELLSGKKSITAADTSYLSSQGRTHGGDNCFLSSLWPFHPRFHPEKWFFLMEEVFGRHGYIWGAGNGHNALLGNECFCRDLYDFIKSWTHLSIGEVTFVSGEVVNSQVDAFANLLIRRAGFADQIDLPDDSIFGDSPFNGQLAILMAHVDVSVRG